MKAKVAIAFLLALLVGCSTARVEQSQTEKVKAYATEVFDDCSSYALMPVGSKGEQTDLMVMKTRALTGYPSVPAQQFARSVESARTQKLCMAVTGVSSKFTAFVIIEALSLSENRDLQGLRLLFVGNNIDRESVQSAVEKRGGTFFFRPI